MAERRLDAGETLFEIGDDGGEVFIVLSGELEVCTPSSHGEVVVGCLGPDDVTGEITAVIGGTRTATVRATTPARVQGLAGDEFEAWLAKHPERAERLASDARARIDRTRVAQVVAELVGPEHRDLIDEMTDAVDWITIEAGTALFEQGDESDAAYVLVGGQMRIIATTEGRTTLDTRIGRGDLLGEMGIIEDAPRSASAIAVRDCTLARIPRTDFERLTAKHPSLMLPMARKVISRFSDRTRSKPHAGTIALAITAPAAEPDLGDALASIIAERGATLHLDAERIAGFLNRRDIAQAASGSIAETRLTEFLHEVDVAHRWVVLECDAPDSAWSQRALRTADRVVVVTSTHPSADERQAIASVRRTVETTGDFDLWVAPLQRAGTRRPQGTTELLALTGATRAVQLRAGDAGSTRRLARLVSGTGLGIALSGGGARSYGQAGALRALHELGIEIDAIAGTSMGAIIGGYAALVDDFDHTLETYGREFDDLKVLDYTLPFASIFSARKATSALERVFGSATIEDAMVPFVCLSTNLSRAELLEHRRGDMVHAIRASMSLPGVFPPVAMGEDLLVDGGVLENLPTRPLKEDPGIETIIALDVAPPGGPTADPDHGLSLTGTDILRHRLQRTDFQHPPLAHTVISSMLVGSARARIDALDNEDIDLYVSMDIEGVKLLDFDKFHEAVACGYRDAKPALEAWLAGGS